MSKGSLHHRNSLAESATARDTLQKEKETQVTEVEDALDALPTACALRPIVFRVKTLC
ncbi:hypothetical protein [Porphyromonas sp.]|uniref:hypothetical protein n=1 Tax=Porphyromonas sp. TaxID=1924944 RepID=UPI003AAAF069